MNKNENITLVDLALAHARGEITDEQAREQAEALPPVILHREYGENNAIYGGDSWYEGDYRNTITQVQGLVGTDLTLAQFNAFLEAISPT